MRAQQQELELLRFRAQLFGFVHGDDPTASLVADGADHRPPLASEASVEVGVVVCSSGLI